MTEPHLADALRDLVREPVVPPALATRVKHAHARRRQRRLAAAGVASVAVVAGVVTLGPAAARRPDSATSPSERVLGANGVVVAAPGQPVSFCRNEPVADVLLPNRAPSPPECRTSVVATGVDLARLAYRQERDGTVWGTAWLEGTYAGGTLAVTSQEAPRPVTPDPDPTFGIPCPPPPGGWEPMPPKVSEPLPVVAWGDAHPGLIVGRRIGYDGRTPVQVVVATDVAAVEAGLKPIYGNGLCVVQSRYTAEQVDAAIRDVAAFLEMPWLTQADIDDETQMHMDVPVALVDAEAEALVARHAPGLIRLDPWLRPVS